MGKGQVTARIPWISVGIISASALAYEILLTRLFAIVHWHHVASIIISLALLGYGVSGTFLSLLGQRLLRRFAAIQISLAVGFAVSAVVSYLIAQRIPLNPLELPWDPRQFFHFISVVLLLVVPFFAAATFLGLALWQFKVSVHRVYAADLLGAGVGAVSIVVLLFGFPPGQALLVIGFAGILGAMVAALELYRQRRPFILGLAVIVGALFWLLPHDWVRLLPADYKDLSQTMAVLGAEVETERHSPLGVVTLVRNDKVPFRFAPGMSLTALKGPPRQHGLYLDSNSVGAVTQLAARDDLSFVDALTSALPYHLLDRPEVLVLGAGGGAAVVQALYHQARLVHAVELNPQVIDLIRFDFAEFTGALYTRPEVRLYQRESRGFVETTQQTFDLIQLDLLDSFSGTSAGLQAQNESYLYTLEALETYMKKLNAGGLLAVTRWLRLPPRDSLKLVASVKQVLQAAGETNVGQRLALIRSWKTSTLLVKQNEFTAQDIAALRRFCHARSFDLVYYPGIQAAEANRFNRLDAPDFFTGVQQLLGPNAKQFSADYRFFLEPATDEKPYFFHFTRWHSLPEILRQPARTGMAHLDWGYWIQVAALIQAVLLSVILILLPLKWLPGEAGRKSRMPWRTLVYFSAIGVAFMFLEIGFIQKFHLFLSHPLYAIAVVLAGFLAFAGVGSHVSGHPRLRALQDAGHRRRLLIGVAVVIAAIVLLYIQLLPMIFRELMALPDAVKVLCSLLAIAPLAFLMGFPFPLGMSHLSTAAGAQIPWAWGVNGCASVVSAVLAPLVAMEVGFNGLAIAAVVGYGVAAASLPASATKGTY